MYTVKDLYQSHKERLGLELVTSEQSLKRRILVPEVHRPGLSLCGFLKHHSSKRILIFGRVELGYLKDLDAATRLKRIEPILSSSTPAVIIARRYRPPKELHDVCNRQQVPLFRANMNTMSLMNKLTMVLNEEFSPTASCHGSLVEVFGVGVLIQGDSSVGKSEAALGLVERGHRLVSDDIVKVKRREAGYLEGSGAELTRYHMEIRGIGIINVSHLYGAVCVRENKSIDIIVKMEAWNDQHFYDRVGLDDRFCNILGVKLPYLVLPVKPGRDVVLLLETIALNHRLKGMGYHSAQEFSNRLLEVTSGRQAAPTNPFKTRWPLNPLIGP